MYLLISSLCQIMFPPESVPHVSPSFSLEDRDVSQYPEGSVPGFLNYDVHV